MAIIRAYIGNTFIKFVWKIYIKFVRKIRIYRSYD